MPEPTKQDMERAAVCIETVSRMAKEIGELKEINADLLEACEQLYAMVQGECPQILEDDHHDEMIRAAIAKAKRGAL